MSFFQLKKTRYCCSDQEGEMGLTCGEGWLLAPGVGKEAAIGWTCPNCSKWISPGEGGETAASTYWTLSILCARAVLMVYTR